MRVHYEKISLDVWVQLLGMLSVLAVLLLTFSLFAQLASADVSGNWTFAVSLSDAGSGNSEITMAQEAEGKMLGGRLVINWLAHNK